MFEELGSCAKHAQIFDVATFITHHQQLKPILDKEFNAVDKGSLQDEYVPTKLRLSAALHIFSGHSVYDIT